MFVLRHRVLEAHSRDIETCPQSIVIAVMQDKDMRRQMLEDALDELGVFEKKYAHLKELTGVFVASKRARESLIQTQAA